MEKAFPDDAMLISWIREGDSTSLGRLYDKYARFVYGLALRMTGDGGAAEEITQDVFTRVWRNAGSYRPERASVETWIMRIARNRSIDELRRLRVRPDRSASGWDEAGEMLSFNGDPGDEVMRDAERVKVRRAVAALPAEQREALAMAFFDGYTHVQIAAALGQPVGTVKTRIRLAMRKLRQVLDDADSRPRVSSGD